MNDITSKIDHLEVTIDPYAPLYSEPITFVEQCQLLSEPIKQLQIAWGNKDTFPRILEVLMRMNWYAQRLPLQPKGSFARPSGFMECSIKRAMHTLQILTTLSFYPRLPTRQKYQEIERVKLTAVIAALLSSVGEPAVNFEVVSFDGNRQLIKRKNEYERLDRFLNEDAASIHINFQDPPPKEFYSCIAIDLMHEIVPEDLMQDIALAYDRNLRRFLQNFVGRHFIQAEVANHKLFNCLISADVITQDREFAFSGKRVDKTPLPHLQHEMEIVLAHKFKGDWAKEPGKAKYCNCVTCWKGDLWIRYPLGFEEIAEFARKKWPFTEIPLNAQSLFSYCSYLGIVKQPPNSDLEEMPFYERREIGGRIKYEEILCPAVILNEPFLYLEEASVWAQELKECLPEKVLEEKLKKKPDVKSIIADLDKKKADITLSIRNKKESPLNTSSGTSGSSIIAMATEFLNLNQQKLEKERNAMKGSPIEAAKKSVNSSAIKAESKKQTSVIEESMKEENLYPFVTGKPPEETQEPTPAEPIENIESVEEEIVEESPGLFKRMLTFIKKAFSSYDESTSQPLEPKSLESGSVENEESTAGDITTQTNVQIVALADKANQKTEEAIKEFIESKKDSKSLATDHQKVLTTPNTDIFSTNYKNFSTLPLGNLKEDASKPKENTPKASSQKEKDIPDTSKNATATNTNKKADVKKPINESDTQTKNENTQTNTQNLQETMPNPFAKKPSTTATTPAKPKPARKRPPAKPKATSSQKPESTSNDTPSEEVKETKPAPKKTPSKAKKTTKEVADPKSTSQKTATEAKAKASSEERQPAKAASKKTKAKNSSSAKKKIVEQVA